MFETASAPRLYAMPPGVDFAESLVLGLKTRLEGAPPEAMARVELILNTRRMQRRVETVFDRFGAVELNVALTALVIGSALLTLSAFWTPIRRVIVEQLPANIQGRLPIAAAALPSG